MIEILAGAGPGVSLAKPLGYSGPNTDGGSAVLGSTGFTADETFLYTTPVTLECVYWRFFQPANDVYLIGIGQAGAGFMAIAILSNGNYGFTDAIHAQADTAFAADSGKWVHVAVTDDGVTGRLYVNGTQRYTQATGAISKAYHPSVANKPDIGSAAGVPVAALTECAIYLSALSGAQVNAHAAALDTNTAPPVFNSASLAPGGAGSPVYTDASTLILSDVTKNLGNAP